MRIRKKIKNVFRAFGVDVKKYAPESRTGTLFLKMLQEHNINLFFDIGANEGQFGQSLRETGYKGRIVSFEPLSAAYQKLIANSKTDDLWQVAPQTAVGDEDGEIAINIAYNSESSSILNILESHTNAAEESRYIASEKVPLSKLDSVCPKYIDNDSVVFLKIDTQGYEDRILKGAPQLIKKTAGIQLELSLIPLYENQKLFDEMIPVLKNMGFELWSIEPVFHDLKTGRVLQVDATFFRS